jgi:hypothetical protein
MTGREIHELLFGKTMAGYFMGFRWSVNTEKNGEIEAVSFDGKVYKGKSWIEGDAICRQYETRYDGFKDCADIYRNPEGDERRLSEYLLLTDYFIFPFSVEE